MKATNPTEAFRELQAAIEIDDDPVIIDELPNKDWLRKT